MKQLKTIESFYKVVEDGKQSMVYFYTKWCPDCFMVKGYIKRLESDFPDCDFYSFNRDDSIELAKHLEIYGVPSFLLFQDGEEIGRFVNKLRKSYIEVKAFIEESTK